MENGMQLGTTLVGSLDLIALWKIKSLQIEKLKNAFFQAPKSNI